MPEGCWSSPCRFLLLPFSLLFGLLAKIRRVGYEQGFLESGKLPVPVLIVGNITAGGSGKTPLVAALADRLSSIGFHPGIVSRGYGGSAQQPACVETDSDPGTVGDEPILLRRSGYPVWVGKKRIDAARRLLESNPRCDILIADDGLQHYAMRRDFEIAVIDSEKGFGNGLLLPAGPLREPLSRLGEVDAIVFNGGPVDLDARTPKYLMTLKGNAFKSVDHVEISANASEFKGKRIHAMAGIGNPERFFSHLSSLGLNFIPHAFPDHHPYARKDLEFDACDIILMTEKDAIKCRGFAPGKCWYLPVRAEFDAALVDLIVKTLGKKNGS